MSAPASLPSRWAYRGEALLAAILFCGLLALKALAAARYRFNSDETQHLHVIWGWTQGLVQYRDLFDNHPPLFHLLLAPVFRLFPERADIVVPMRMLMLPLYAATLAGIFQIGRLLYSPRAGAWLALLGGALPWFFFPGTEFRPDDLYAAVWIWVLAIAVEGTFTRTRMIVLGFLLGVCVTLTLKTALAGVSLLLAAAIVLGLRYRLSGWRMPVREILVRLALGGAAGVIAPGLICLYFASRGALPSLFYCVFRHNLVPHAERWGTSHLHDAYLPIALPFLIMGAAWIYRRNSSPELATRRIVISLVPLFYGLLLYSYWPDITPQDNLPYVPLLPFAAAPLLCAWASRFPPETYAAAKWTRYLLPPAAVLLSVCLIFRTQEIKRSVTKYITPIATVLHLTRSGEEVLDLKGDAIYRPRPFYYIVETFTNARLKLGWIKNDIVPDLIATRTAVCFHPPFPGKETMAFIDHNYVPLASQPKVLVLGQTLTPDPHSGTVDFQVAIPGDYVLEQNSEPVRGLLDGMPYNRSRHLDTGPHHFASAMAARPLVLFWARAWDLGYRPQG